MALSAVHCFSDSTWGLGTNSVTGAPLVRVSFDPNLANSNPADRVWNAGSYYWDPQFMLGGGGGLPGFDTHDVAVIIFTTAGCSTPTGTVSTYRCGPVPAAATGGRYAALPGIGLADTLPMNSPVDVVSYGVQNFINGGGPCTPNCKKLPGASATRFYAAATWWPATTRSATSSSSCTRTRAAPASVTPAAPTCGVAPTSSSA